MKHELLLDNEAWENYQSNRKIENYLEMKILVLVRLGDFEEAKKADKELATVQESIKDYLMKIRGGTE